MKSAENGERGSVQKILTTSKGSVNQQSCVRHSEQTHICINPVYNTLHSMEDDAVENAGLLIYCGMVGHSLSSVELQIKYTVVFF